MSSLWLFNLSLHLFAAFLWIGCSAFFSLLWVPMVRRSIDPISWQELRLGLGRRYLRWSWAAIEILLLTGILNILRVGLERGFAFQPAFLRRLIGKLLIVLVMIGFQTGLSLVWMPKLAKGVSGEEAERPVRRALVATSVGGAVAMWLAMMLRG